MIVEGMALLGGAMYLFGKPIGKALVVNRLIGSSKKKIKMRSPDGKTFKVTVDEFVDEKGNLIVDFSVLEPKGEKNKGIVLTKAELEAAGLAEKLKQILSSSKGLTKNQLVSAPKYLIAACERLVEEKKKQPNRMAEIVK